MTGAIQTEATEIQAKTLELQVLEPDEKKRHHALSNNSLDTIGNFFGVSLKTEDNTVFITPNPAFTTSDIDAAYDFLAALYRRIYDSTKEKTRHEVKRSNLMGQLVATGKPKAVRRPIEKVVKPVEAKPARIAKPVPKAETITEFEEVPFAVISGTSGVPLNDIYNYLSRQNRDAYLEAIGPKTGVKVELGKTPQEPFLFYAAKGRKQDQRALMRAFDAILRAQDVLLNAEIHLDPKQKSLTREKFSGIVNDSARLNEFSRWEVKAADENGVLITVNDTTDGTEKLLNDVKAFRDSRKARPAAEREAKPVVPARQYEFVSQARADVSDLDAGDHILPGYALKHIKGFYGVQIAYHVGTKSYEITPRFDYEDSNPQAAREVILDLYEKATGHEDGTLQLPLTQAQFSRLMELHGKKAQKMPGFDIPAFFPQAAFMITPVENESLDGVASLLQGESSKNVKRLFERKFGVRLDARITEEGSAIYVYLPEGNPANFREEKALVRARAALVSIEEHLTEVGKGARGKSVVQMTNIAKIMNNMLILGDKLEGLNATIDQTQVQTDFRQPPERVEELAPTPAAVPADRTERDETDVADAPAPQDRDTQIIVPYSFGRSSKHYPQKLKYLSMAVEMLGERSTVRYIHVEEESERVVFSTTTPQAAEVVSHFLQELVDGIDGGQTYSPTGLRSIFSRAYDSLEDGRKKKKESRTDSRAENKEELDANTPITHVVETIGEAVWLGENVLLEPLAEALKNNKRFKAFSSLYQQRFNAEISLDTATVQRGGVSVPVPGLKVYFPYYMEESLTESTRAEILNSLAFLAREVKEGGALPATEIDLGNQIDLSLKRALQKRRENEQQTDTLKSPSGKRIGIRVTEINGKSIKDFANYIGNGRQAALRAFSERRQSLGFDISLVGTEEDRFFFQVSVPGTEVGFEERVLNVAKFMLADLRHAFVKKNRINADYIRGYLDRKIPEMQAQSREKLGDNLTVIFASMANREGRIVHTEERPLDLRLANAGEAPLVYSVEELPPPLYTAPEIRVPDFDLNNIMTLKTNRGMVKQIIPTPNQWKYIRAVMDPNVRCVLVQGPPGSGKTLFSAWSLLTLLKLGQTAKIFYDRPLEVVGSHKLGALPGGMDDKLGPYNDVLVNEFCKLLGGGDSAAGRTAFDMLVGAGYVERYDELFKRGDTVDEGILFVDECQNKTDTEIFHLLTRIGERGKVILGGDGEFQVDVRNSGWIRATQMYRNVPGVVVIEFGAEDIKRSEFVQGIYNARRAFEAAAAAQREQERLPPAKRDQAASPTAPKPN